jgi:hypothetical protein
LDRLRWPQPTGAGDEEAVQSRRRRGQIATPEGIEAAAAFCVLRRNNLKRAIIQEIQISVSCLANACGVAQDGLEYWVEFSPKRADDLQHFRSGMLLFPSFA